MTQAKNGKTHGYSSLAVIWFFLKPYRRRVIALLVLCVVVGGLEALNLAAIYPILNAAFEADSGQSNVIFSLLESMADLFPIQDEFVAYCVVFLVLAILTFAVKLVLLKFKVNLGADLVTENQSKVFEKYSRADYQYFIDHRQGDLLYNAATAPGKMPHLITATTELTSQAILSVSVLALLFMLSWQGTLAVLVVGIGYYYLSRYLGEKISYRSGKGEMEALRESNVILNETISGIKQIKVFVSEQNRVDKFVESVKRRFYHFRKRTIWREIPTVSLMLVFYLTIGTIALVAKITAPGDFGDIIPTFGTFSFALFRLFPMMGTVGALLMSIKEIMPDCEVVYSIQNDRLTHIEDGQKELTSFESEIQFDNVSFAYEEQTRILEDIPLTFERGKSTAIVGRSGAGKTTIINLLLRLFDPSKGEIRIDGADLREYRLASWLSKVGYVSQDTFILNDTVANNIAFGSDRYSHEEVVRAAKYADAHDFVSELPEGYDTLVGDKGVKLSGGQRQRIAIARAMIREPEVLIFDEATNALDSISEEVVQEAIDRIAKDRTVIIIAHRLATIVNADRILVLEDGRIVEEGTHSELLENRGAYWALYNSQSV